MVMTSYDKGIVRGQRQALQMQLEARFGTLAPKVQQQLESAPPERVRELILACAKGQTLQEMGLEE